MEPIHFKTRAAMAEAITRAEQAGAEHYVPLFRAAMVGDIALAFVAAGQSLPLRILDRRMPRPLVVVLGDDDAHPTGPGSFPQARRLLRWAGFTLIHAAGAQAWHYGAAVEMARILGRVVVVETGTAHQAAWVDLKKQIAPHTPGLVLAVPQGAAAHPHMAAPAGTVFQ